METFHFLRTCLGEKAFSKSNLNPLGCNVGPDLLLLPGRVWPHASPPFLCVPWLGAALSCPPTARLNRPSCLSPPDRLAAVIHWPATVGSWQGPHVSLGQHHHVGALPPGLVAPACSSSLSSSQARRRDPTTKGHVESTITTSMSGQQEEGTAGSVPPCPQAVSAGGQGPGHRHLPQELLLYQDPSISLRMLL